MCRSTLRSPEPSFRCPADAGSIARQFPLPQQSPLAPGAEIDTDPFVYCVGAELPTGAILTAVLPRDDLAYIRLEFQHATLRAATQWSTWVGIRDADCRVEGPPPERSTIEGPPRAGCVWITARLVELSRSLDEALASVLIG